MEYTKNKGEKCKVETCNTDACSKGYCKKHYMVLSRGDNPNTFVYSPPVFDEQKYLNKQFDYLTILKFVEPKYSGAQINRRCLCLCKCGTEKIYYLNNIIRGMSSSCGCKPYKGFKNNITKTEKVLYRLWSAIMNRCYNKNYPQYKDYGGRGIDVFWGWHIVEKFISDIKRILGDKATTQHSLDRIDNNRGYHPDNIRWATQKEQMNNTRYSNVLTAGALAKLTGYTRERIRQLTYKTSSDQAKNNGLPLREYLGREIITDKSIHHIYKPEAIQFLINRRKNPMSISTLFVPFNYQSFAEDNILTLRQLATTLGVVELSLRHHYGENKIRKEHYHILKEKGYNVENYLLNKLEGKVK